MISKSKNRWQTTWKFIKTETAKIENKKGVQSLYITNIIIRVIIVPLNGWNLSSNIWEHP